MTGTWRQWLPSPASWWVALRARFAGTQGAAAHVPIRDWVGPTAAHPSHVHGFDRALVWVVVALLLLGMVMVVFGVGGACRTARSFARYSPTHFL